MSSRDRAKKRELKRQRHGKPSAPRRFEGVNDNEANDNYVPVTIRGVTLTEGQTYRFGIATTKAASANLDQRREAQRMFETLEREIDARRETATAEADIQERRGLEALRGLEITPSKIAGAVGVPEATRDGLKNLTRAWADRVTKQEMPPALDPHGTLYAAALLYRIDYERLDPEKKLTPPTLLREGKTASGGDDYANKIAESWDRVRTIHLMIAGVGPSRDPMSRPNMPNLPTNHPAMRAIHALEEIAGKGRALSDMTSSGSVKARIREDLLFALEACEIVYGLG